MKNTTKPFRRAASGIRTINLLISGAAAASVLALATMPRTADAQPTSMPTYDQAIVCASYYTVLFFYANKKNPGTDQTKLMRSNAADWAKLAQLQMDPKRNFDRDFDAAQNQLNELILADGRESELKQVQTYCLNKGMEHLKWGQ